MAATRNLAPEFQWVPAAHLWAMDDILMDTLLDPLMPRIIVVEAPPRHGKSIYWSKWVPAWYMGQHPDNRVGLVSYGANFAKQWGRQVKEIVIEHGDRFFGVQIRRLVSAASEWMIDGHQGGMQTCGAGGALMGKGFNLVIVDDPIKNSDQAKSEIRLDSLWEWWQSTLTTRMEPGGIIVVTAQRFSERDLAGRLKQAAKDGGSPITVISQPAIAEDGDQLGRPVGAALWPGRWPITELRKIESSKTRYWWLTQYQQTPTQQTGAEWPEDYFGDFLYTQHFPEKFDMAVVYLDPSKGRTNRSDFSGLVFVGLSGGRLWVDAHIRRRPISKIVSDGFWFALGRQCDAFGIESNSFQELFAPEFDRYCQENNAMPLPLVLDENTVNKEVRIRRLGTYLSRRKFVFRDNEDCRLLVRQLKEFPLGEHDDGPDALEGAERLLRSLFNAKMMGSADHMDGIANLG